MTVRAVVLGLGLVLFICALEYFNQHILLLPSMILGAMPLVVFAALVALVLGINPLLGRWALRPPELAVIVAMGVSVCAYNGANYLRYVGPLASLPPHNAQQQPAWQATGVLGYVPGQPEVLAVGHVLEPVELARQVLAHRDDTQTLLGRLWASTPEPDRQTWVRAAAAGALGADHRAAVARLVQRALDGGDLGVDRAGLHEAMPTLIAPVPHGSGVMLGNGAPHLPEREHALLGVADPDAPPSLSDVPWATWAPVLQLWGGVMALLVLSSICLSIIVRPQWAERERLTFPIVRFAELMAGRATGRRWPDVAYHKSFWLGFGVLAVHILGGLHAWFPQVPALPTKLELTPLRDLLPTLAKPWQAGGLFEPELHFTVIAFAFLLPTTISLTFGLTNLAYLLIAVVLLSRGVSISGGGAIPPFHELLSFGAMLGMVAVMIYTGRRYYGQVVASAVVGRGSRDVSGAAVWAARGLVLLLPAAVWLLMTGGLSPLFAGLAVGTILLLWLVTARIVCETGLLRMGSTIVPLSMATALFGYGGVGPTNLIILTMISVILATDLWESPMAYLVTGMQFTARSRIPDRITGPGLAGVTMLGLAVAIVAALVAQNHYGIVGRLDPTEAGRAWAPLGVAANAATDLAATGELAASVRATDVQRLVMLSPEPETIGWIGAGVLLFAVFAAARLRIPGWPIHPVLFVLLGNWGAASFGFSFLVAWAIKAAVVRFLGAEGYHRTLPFMVGVIAAGLASALIWMLIGWIYFFCTRQLPASYLGS